MVTVNLVDPWLCNKVTNTKSPTIKMNGRESTAYVSMRLMSASDCTTLGWYGKD